MLEQRERRRVCNSYAAQFGDATADDDDVNVHGQDEGTTKSTSLKRSWWPLSSLGSSVFDSVTVSPSICSSAEMNVGDVFSDSVRRSRAPASVAVRAAWTSMSNRISVWSHTNPTGTTRKLRAPSAMRAVMSALRSGPIQGSGVRPAL